jgi:hypothetical protein
VRKGSGGLFLSSTLGVFSLLSRHVLVHGPGVWSTAQVLVIAFARSVLSRSQHHS